MPRPEQERWDFETVPTHQSYSREYWVKAGRALHRLVREVAQTSPGKQGAGLAEDVAANATQFSEALKPNGVKRFAVEWLPRMIHADPDNRILKFLCALRGEEPKPKPLKNPREVLRRVVERLESKGAMGHELLREEFGADADEIVRSAQAATEDDA
jgi:hypothetical protein